MPIPNFFDGYHLPDGEFECTIKEIENTFLTNEQRRIVWNRFFQLIERIISLGLYPEVVLINGSFVTGRKFPRDVDACVLIRPQVVVSALSAVRDPHDEEAIKMFIDYHYELIIRNLFGCHLLIVPDENGLTLLSKFFREGLNGRLRDPDPYLDPHGVVTPPRKGILKVQGGEFVNAVCQNTGSY